MTNNSSDILKSAFFQQSYTGLPPSQDGVRTREKVYTSRRTNSVMSPCFEVSLKVLPITHPSIRYAT